MGFANLTDPNYKLQTDAEGRVVDIVSSTGKSSLFARLLKNAIGQVIGYTGPSGETFHGG